MIDQENIEELREAAQLCVDTVDDMYLIMDDEDVPEHAQDVEELLCGAYENIHEAISLLKKG